MSITISNEDGKHLHLNAWNWGVIHYLVEKAQLFPQDIWEPARYLGTDLTTEQANQLADFLESSVMRHLLPGERMFFEGTTTNSTDDGTLFREADEQWKNYSLHQDILAKVLQFLRSSSGSISFY
jgi:hypothetical protein